MTRAIVSCLLFGLTASTEASASEPGTRLFRASHPICRSDLSDVPLPEEGRLLSGPRDLDRHAIRPGILKVQDDICRCMPRSRHQPARVRAELRIHPNEGRVDIHYMLDGPLSPPQKRMRSCLGSPTMDVTPMPYRSDMVTEDGPVDEVLKYPVHMILDEDAVEEAT